MIPKQLSKLKFCRVRPKTKKPFEKDWTNKPYTLNEIQKFLLKENYGVLCGYENLAVIDCDDEIFAKAVEILLPKTFSVKTGGGGMHYYFFIPDLKQKIILEIDNKHLGEIQSCGTQVVGPNSIHPNGNKYEVINNEDIKTISGEDLLNFIKPFIKKQIQEVEESAKFERQSNSEIDNLSVTDIWGTAGLKYRDGEYYGCHPIHGSAGGVNFWINPSKNTWHCFRCNSGGGSLSAIGVKEGVISCSEARRGNLRGERALETIKIAKSQYGLKDKEIISTPKIKIPSQTEVDIIWEKDLESWEEEGKEWVIEKLLPTRAVSFLTGKRGTLKTFIALQMAHSVASGNDFLGRYPIHQGKVIYLDKENGVNIIKKRMAMLKRGLEEEKSLDIGFICFSQLKLDKLGDSILIEKIIEEHKPKLLIIDTYRRAVGFDENDAGKVSALFVDTLRPIVEKYNLSLLLIHHDRKSSGRGDSVDEMDEMRGSSDLANYADIILKTERKGKKIILKQLKNRNAEEEVPQEIEVEFSENSDPYVKLIHKGEYSKGSLAESFTEDIILWIEEKELTTFNTSNVRELALQKGVKKNNMHNALINLQDRGIIENVGKGKYNVKEI